MLHVLLLLALSSSSFGADVTLSSEDDFTDFASNVNKGTNYSGTTVYLDSDITLTESIDSIGNDTNNYFRGIFDGQGHIISNLTLNASSNYTGLFGYSNGLTTRNVVLDSSCSITSTLSGSNVHVGGIIGYCGTSERQCSIENSVNMADVAFSGSISSNLYIGGTIGSLSSSNYNAYVKNSVNYGSVTNSGKVGSYAYLGGIVGISDGTSIQYNYVQNCLNYGSITYSGSSSNSLIIGGIVGYSTPYAYIENCVSAGEISTSTTASTKNYSGSIVGYINSNTHINYCYYTSDVNASSTNGTGTPSSTIGTPNIATAVNSDLVSKLNNNATSYNWNKWLLNANNATVTFKMSDNKELSFSSQVILVPNPVKEGNSFLFWCKDAELTEEFEAESVSGNTTLYAAWVNNTVTFNVSGGNDLPDNEVSKIITFNEKYGVLPKPNRTGYMFLGWFNESNELITSETIVTTSHNHTLYARWEEVTNQVEIVFSTKDLTEEEVEELIERYTKAKFTIAEYENESGDIRVIIKFADKEDAENFIERIKESDEMKNIKKIGFISNDTGSFSTMIYPFSFFSVLFLWISLKCSQKTIICNNKSKNKTKSNTKENTWYTFLYMPSGTKFRKKTRCYDVIDTLSGNKKHVDFNPQKSIFNCFTGFFKNYFSKD